ncbi:GNAT family N-acetyltransferase [Haliea sp. E17]|uniref:GNAT family N-acetyltransferase n=1 Tax=Haliea sp. E17 TaxID=3401576 RepID=UPI003AAB7D12
MTVLVPMREEEFNLFLLSSATAYADDNIKSGRWLPEGAHDRAISELRDLLPQGIDTPDNYLFEILASPDGAAVGYIWCAIQDNHGQRSAFVYDVEIKPEFRRQGYATDAFISIQEHLAALGLESIGLHVFAFNEGAIALYKRLGFEVTGVNMQKKLNERLT